MSEQLANDERHRTIGAIAKQLDTLPIANRAKIDRTSVNLMLLPSMFAGGFIAAILAPYTVRVMPNDALKYVIPGYAVVLAIVLFVQLV